VKIERCDGGGVGKTMLMLLRQLSRSCCVSSETWNRVCRGRFFEDMAVVRRVTVGVGVASGAARVGDFHRSGQSVTCFAVVSFL
jgi:hypothetical protein